jgi:hypothetical protein
MKTFSFYKIFGHFGSQTSRWNTQKTSLPEKVEPNFSDVIKPLFPDEPKLITISPGGFKVFYELGILSFLRDNYNLSDFYFSGASAGSWNSLFMSYNKDYKILLSDLFDEKTIKNINIRQIQSIIKGKLLEKYSTEDFDLHRIFIGITTFHKFRFETKIINDFYSLEDAIDCCIASSHIPWITNKDFFYRYRNNITFDGGIGKYPYLKSKNTLLHISPNIWKKSTQQKSYFLSDIIGFLSLFFKSKDTDVMELFTMGYKDAEKHKDILDNLFL